MRYQQTETQSYCSAITYSASSQTLLFGTLVFVLKHYYSKYKSHSVLQLAKLCNNLGKKLLSLCGPNDIAE